MIFGYIVTLESVNTYYSRDINVFEGYMNFMQELQSYAE